MPLFSKLLVGYVDECACGIGNMASKHVLEECLAFAEQRKLF